MCRYGMYGPYKQIYACFPCRKVFKQTSKYEMTEEEWNKIKHSCPQCGEGMKDMGYDFKAPKQTDVKQWKKVEILYEHGFTYHSCGCGGPGYRPTQLQEVNEFLEKNKRFNTEGEKLLNRLTVRM
ncbi:hypothetical protein GPJ61_03155 [Brevibacillus formosus]|uniref:hypothetical protein n=1 Tax=Brevibacillus formosus TaxID=54913 RepID=UPI001CA5129B|nr:hypothetical protein [Brevibacillus formosus]MBW5466874.1 hypothetical protein [Brevibacillus formosus]